MQCLTTKHISTNRESKKKKKRRKGMKTINRNKKNECKTSWELSTLMYITSRRYYRCFIFVCGRCSTTTRINKLKRPEISLTMY